MSFVIVGGAAIFGGTALASAYIQSKSAEKAADAQSEAAQAGIAESNKQFEAMQRILAPFVQAGTGALQSQEALAGLRGTEEQKSAIQEIEQSPEFASLTKQGETSILQNASATGGLRGGNTEAALAQFRPQLLSSLINQQYSRLGGLSQLGQASAAGVGSAGIQTGANVADLLGQIGSAQAGQAIASGNAFAQIPGMAVQGALAGYGFRQGGGF